MHDCGSHSSLMRTLGHYNFLTVHYQAGCTLGGHLIGSVNQLSESGFGSNCSNIKPKCPDIAMYVCIWVSLVSHS